MSEAAPTPLDGLDVHEVDDGLVIYDTGNDRVHYLNETASLVFALCDGERDAEAIAGLLQQAWALEAPPSTEVRECLEQLREEGVLR